MDGALVRLWAGHVRAPDIVVTRRGATALQLPASDVLLLAEITSPGEYREAAQSVDGVLRSSVLRPFEGGLRALALGR